jgi:hypothetical protein
MHVSGAMTHAPLIPMEWGLCDGNKTETHKEGQRAHKELTCEHKKRTVRCLIH